MADEPRSIVRIKGFRGMSTDTDPFDNPPGMARISVNLESHDPGVLRSRKGYVPATIESGEVVSSSYYTSMAFYGPPHANFLVGRLFDETEEFLRNPSLD